THRCDFRKCLRVSSILSEYQVASFSILATQVMHARNGSRRNRHPRARVLPARIVFPEKASMFYLPQIASTYHLPVCVARSFLGSAFLLTVLFSTAHAQDADDTRSPSDRGEGSSDDSSEEPLEADPRTSADTDHHAPPARHEQNPLT